MVFLFVVPVMAAPSKAFAPTILTQAPVVGLVSAGS
jgi:hypothetical protein